MNILKIIKFIGEKNPKYEMDNLKLPIRPVKGKGYMDDNGLKQGEWEGYYDNGELESKGNYKDDKKVGYWEHYYNGNGELSSKGNYKNDVKDGYWEGYYRNGKLEYKGNYKDGFKDGYWEGYYSNGQVLLLYKENYMDGIKID